MLTIVALSANVIIHKIFLYNKQFSDYKEKFQIESIDLSNSIANHEIIGVLNSMAKRSSLLNDSVNGHIIPDSPLVVTSTGVIFSSNIKEWMLSGDSSG